MKGKKRREPSPEVEARAGTDYDLLLRELRAQIEASGQSLRSIAQASGISADTLSATLRGRRQLKLPELPPILAALGLTPREFFRKVYRYPAAAPEEP